MDHPHILLISLDTVRRDHLGCYGYRRELTPNLDRLADGGVRFRDSVANCGWTLPQHMTLLTGLYPFTHGVIQLDNPPLSPRWTLLSEHLKQSGYRTFAVVNQNHYGGGAQFGFDRGFDEHVVGADFNQHMPWTEQAAVERFRAHHESGPCFMYVHVNDTHEPFQPPEPWLSMWGPSYHNRYEGELSYVDHYLGRVFTAMSEMGVLQDTLIVVAADHGTEFWEHEFLEKKCNLYREILDVPLIIRYPARIPAGRVVDGLVESAMVAPTILDLAGLPPLPDAQGASLAPRILGRSDEAPDSVCAHTVHSDQEKFGPAQFDHFAIRTLDFKFIRTEVHAEPDELFSDWKQRLQAILLRAGHDPAELEAGTVIRELYDLRVDPDEHYALLPPRGRPGWPQLSDTPPVERAKEIAHDLETKLDAWIEETRRAGRDR